MGSQMNVNVTETVTLENTDSVVHFKNKITDTIDFLLKSYATPDNPAVQFNISINVSEFKGTSSFNKKTNTEKPIVREINNEIKKEDLEYENIMLSDMITAAQQRITLKSTAVQIINEKILKRVQPETNILGNCQKSFEENKKKPKKLSKRQKARAKKIASLMEYQKEMENQTKKGIKRQHESNEQNEANEYTEVNRLMESVTTLRNELNVPEGNQILENSFSEPKRSDLWNSQMVKRQSINKNNLLMEPEASGGNGQEQFTIESNVLGESSRLIPQLKNYALDIW